MSIDFSILPTPCYVLDEDLLRQNLMVLQSVQTRTGCRILLALKGFSMFATFPLIGQYLAGITASSLFEARLGFEEMGKEVHIYAPAYIEADFRNFAMLRPYCLQLFRPVASLSGTGQKLSGTCGRMRPADQSRIFRGCH